MQNQGIHLSLQESQPENRLFIFPAELPVLFIFKQPCLLSWQQKPNF